MIRNKGTYVVAGVLCAGLLSGCTTQSEPVEILGVEANDLGITQIEITRTVAGAEHLLSIRGLGLAGDEIGSATLRTGRVEISNDPAQLKQSYDGRELIMTVGTETYPIVNPNRDRLDAGEPPLPKVASFVHLTPVADALFEEAAYRFAHHAKGADTDGEVAFNVGTCSPVDFPTNKGNPAQCCMAADPIAKQTWHKISGGGVGVRDFEINGKACRTSSGSSACSGAGCYYGPCGGKVEFSLGGAPADVFYPVTNTSVCGWHVSNPNAWSPEAFTNQATYPGMAAACACTDCSNGMPTGGTSSTCDSCRGLPDCSNGVRAYLRGAGDVNKICGTHHACNGNPTTCGTGAGLGVSYSICTSSQSSLSSWCSSTAIENGKIVYTNCL